MFLLPATLVVASLSLTSEPAPCQVFRDSAGVRIVRYGSRSPLPPAWTVDQRPFLEIGGVRGEGPYLFSRISSVVRLSDGSIVVADRDTPELRVFGSTGRFLRSIGRRGRGPGEFTTLDSLAAHHDTLVAFDGAFAALRLFTRSGSYVRSIIVPPLNGVSPFRWPIGMHSSGAVFTFARDQVLPVGRDVFTDSLRLVRLSSSGTQPKMLGRFPAGHMWTNPELAAPYSFGFAPQLRAAISRQGYCLGYSERYELECADTLGRVHLAVRREPRHSVVSDSARRALASAMQRRDGLKTGAASAAGWVAHRAKVVKAMQYSKHYPAFAAILIDNAGALWVREYRPQDGIASTAPPASGTKWDVFSPNGMWLAVVTLPRLFVPFQVGEDYVLGVAYDADDVPRILQLRLRRSANVK